MNEGWESYGIPLDEFVIDGVPEEILEHKRGHINSTYIASWNTPRGVRRYVHQRINHNIFRDVPGLMNNVKVVTEHIRAKQACGITVPGDTTLAIVPTHTGATFVRDGSGAYWRTYHYVEGTTSYEVCPDSKIAREAAAALGRFQSYLADLSCVGLIETIPAFLNSPKRFDTLRTVVDSDPVARVGSVKPDIDFALSRAASAGALVRATETGDIPLRVTHNDMKLNNVLFSEKSGQAICIVDLDTCMPGTILYDWGDMVRNTAISAAEDEVNLAKVTVDLELFTALVEGYLGAYRENLNDEEVELLPVAPRILALTLGVRFLTDYLAGDSYFRIHRPSHNLDRARAQFEIVRKMEGLEGEMREIVSRSS